MESYEDWLENWQIAAWLREHKTEILAMVEEDLLHPPMQSNWRELFEDD